MHSSLRPTILVNGNIGYNYSRSEVRTISTFQGLALRSGVQITQSLDNFWRVRGQVRRAKAEIAEAAYATEEVRQAVLAEGGPEFC